MDTAAAGGVARPNRRRSGARTWRVPLAWATVFAILAAVLTVVVAVEGSPLGREVEILRAGQDTHSPVLDVVVDAVNAAGDGADWFVIAGAAALCAWRFAARREGRHVEALVAIGVALAFRWVPYVLKTVAESARPASEDGVIVDSIRTTYGYPSGHVFGDMVTYGIIALFATGIVGARVALPVRVVLVCLVATAGFARMYVGAHWPSDVLGGYLWGATVVCLAVAAGGHVRARYEARQGSRGGATIRA